MGRWQKCHHLERGSGYHKARALFGEDINELFSKLNKSHAWLSAFGNGPGHSMSQEEWGKQYQEHTDFIWITVNKLSDIFRCYMYFGD